MRISDWSSDVCSSDLVKCPDEVCNWVQFRNVCGVQIGIADIESLIIKGKTSLIKEMKRKAGKQFDAYIVLNEDCKTSFEFAKSSYKRQSYCALICIR